MEHYIKSIVKISQCRKCHTNNHLTIKQEAIDHFFVKCNKCGKVGPGGLTRLSATNRWDLNN